jgi:hypothetical protein
MFAGTNLRVAKRERGVSRRQLFSPGASSWEWSVSLGAPAVLKIGKASSEFNAVQRARRIIDEAPQESTPTDRK